MVAAQAVSAKDALIAQLQQQLEQQATSIAASTGDHETNVTKLIKSINEMQQSCQAQVGLHLVCSDTIADHSLLCQHEYLLCVKLFYLDC
jgi:hypothetical protein